MKIIAKVNFKANGREFIAGDEVKGFDYKQIVKLNELGFIESLDYKSLVLIKRELEKEEL